MIKLVLPVYYTQTFKTASKKDNTFLVGMNWYRNAHYFISNEVKTFFENGIIYQLTNNYHGLKLNDRYKITYIYYYKSAVSDLMNVGSLASKFVNDALQSYGFEKVLDKVTINKKTGKEQKSYKVITNGVVIDDNVKYCKEERFLVGGSDIDNPRIEVIIEEVTE